MIKIDYIYCNKNSKDISTACEQLENEGKEVFQILERASSPSVRIFYRIKNNSEIIRNTRLEALDIINMVVNRYASNIE